MSRDALLDNRFDPPEAALEILEKLVADKRNEVCSPCPSLCKKLILYQGLAYEWLAEERAAEDRGPDSETWDYVSRIGVACKHGG